MTIKVLSKNGCPGCMILKQYLGKKGVTFEEVNVIDNPDVATKYGVKTLPVILLLNGEEELDRVLQFNPPMVDKLISKVS